MDPHPHADTHYAHPITRCQTCGARATHAITYHIHYELGDLHGYTCKHCLPPWATNKPT